MIHVSNGFTSNGARKTTNEDFFLTNDDLGLYIVCDGSAEGDGAWAARATCQKINEYLLINQGKLFEYNGNPSPTLRQELEQLLHNAVQFASEYINQEKTQDVVRKGRSFTTVDALLVLADTFLIAHAGNARIYLFRDQKLHQITEDDTTFNRMVKAGSTPASVNKQLKKQLLNAIGFQKYVPITIKSLALIPEDLFILCTDGFYNGFSDTFDDESQIINDMVVIEAPKNDLDNLPRTLVNSVDKRSADNVTVLVVKESGAEKTPSKSTIDKQLLKAQIEQIKKLKVFKNISNEEPNILLLHRLFKPLKFKKGQPIVSQGAESSELFIIIRGTAHLVVNGEPKDFRYSPGDSIGELGVFTNEPRSATVIATEDMDVITISRTDLMALIAKDPKLGNRIYEGVIAEIGNKLRFSNQSKQS
jgi:PPM family protein phosphatase